jgi:hypothetical protein
MEGPFVKDLRKIESLLNHCHLLLNKLHDYW